MPLRATSYPVTPVLSVDAVQERRTLLDDTALPVRLVGVLGGERSIDQLATAGVGSVPATVVDLTENVCAPLARLL